jgi:dihydroorotate dehydrogenase electron transfer subunit
VKDRDSPLVARSPLGRDYAVLTFEHPEIAAGAAAGQFAMLQPVIGSEPLLRRPFSIMDTDPAAGTFSIFLKAIGAGSRSLFDMRIGEAARALGPLGRGFSAPRPGEESILVAGGYGVAPFALFARRGRPFAAGARLYYGGRSDSELPFVDELRARGYEPVLSTDDGSRGHRGRVTEPLLRFLDSKDGRRDGARRIYACGPHPMMKAVAAIAAERAIPCEVSLDPWMGCGLGTCLGCVVRIRADEGNGSGGDAWKNRPACTAGPVFDAREVVW